MLTIYSKKKCAACLSAANLLQTYDIPFTTIKVDEDVEAKAFIIGRGFRTVPQIFHGDKLFVEGGWLGLMKMTKEEINAVLYGTGE